MPNLKVAGYVRVSRVAGRAGASFQSPDAQEEAIRAYCRARGLRVAEVARELDVSGKTMKRPKLQRLVAEIRAGRLAGIVVWRLDRFARTLVGGIETLAEIHDAGGFVQTVEGGIDTSATSGAMGELQLNLLLTLAQWERAVRAEGFESAKQRAVARGVHISGTVPVGYVRPGKGQPLALDEERADAVRAAFELRASGASLADVGRLLDERIPGGPSGRGSWDRTVIADLLVNRVYTGEARQGRFRKPDAHPAIVSREVFDAAGALARRPEASATTGASSLLAGVARCGHCGYALHRKKVAKRWRVYACTGHSASGDCPAPTSVMADKLDAFVRDAVREKLAGPAIEMTPIAVDLSEIHDALAVARRKREPFEDPDYVALLGVAGATRALAKVDAEIARLEEKLAAEIGEMNGGAPVTISTDEALDELETDEWREVVASMIDSVFVSRGATKRVPVAERATIYWKGDDVPIERPSRGYRHRREGSVARAAA
jgi:DNA invertase Pin-like site-specific DNA recombinase